MDVQSSIGAWNVNSIVANNLLKSGVSSFFPVQQDVIPLLLRNNAQLCITPRDICVSAPTGSGKTISYALPILSILQKETVRRLRALILLPSRELAIQVHKVFVQLSEGTDVRTALATGQRNEEEKALLVGLNSVQSGKRKHHLVDELFSLDQLYREELTSLGKSNVDIIICTPGRLLDHIQQTEGFTLQHLRFLVLDEADRLLGNAYQSWVRTLLQSTHSAPSISTGPRTAASVAKLFTPTTVLQDRVASIERLSVAPEQPLQRLLFSATLTDNPSKLALLGIYNPLLIHSTSWKGNRKSAVTTATAVAEDNVPAEESDKELTEVAPADTLDANYMLPAGLSESKITCETADRPVTLLRVLAEVFSLHDVEQSKEVPVGEGKSIAHRELCGSESGSGRGIVIIFASSVPAVHRLCLLLQLVNHQLDVPSTKKKAKKETTQALLFHGKVAELSSNMEAGERERTLQEAQEGVVRVLVCSDQMARGMDLPNIRLVINYDVPTHAEVYVHRAGRTARAGKEGHCLTILKKNQVLPSGLPTANNDMLKCQLHKSSKELAQSSYDEARPKLASVLENEEE